MNERNRACADRARFALRAALFVLCGSLLFHPVSLLIEEAIYPTLADLLPGLFPTYDFIAEREAYRAQLAARESAAAALAFFAAFALALRTDNRRYERVVTQTDGLYRMREGFALYLGWNLGGDLIAIAAAPLPLLLLSLLREALQKVPEKAAILLRLTDGLSLLLRGFDRLFAPHGAAVGYLLTLCVLLLSWLPAVALALRGWRAGWLTSFTE